MKTKIPLYFIILIFLFSPLIKTEEEGFHPVPISHESTDDHYRVSMAMDTNEGIHIGWKDKSDILQAGSDWDIFHIWMSQNGSWSEPTLASLQSINESTCLFIDTDSKNTVHLAWKDDSDILHAGSDWDIFYAFKPLYGNWSDPSLVSINSSGVCSCPALQVDNNDVVHITWTDNTKSFDNNADADVFYRKKTNEKEWSPVELITKTSGNDAYDVDIASDAYDTIHLVWYEYQIETGAYDVLYTSSINEKNWSEPLVLSSQCTRNSVDPWVEIDTENNVHVIWNDNSDLFQNGNDYDIFYRMKVFQKNWTAPILVSEHSMSDCKWPSLFVDAENTVYVAWSDQTQYNQKDSDYDIVYTSKKQDKKWTPIEVLSTESDYESNWPRFVVDTNHTMHMTWWDRTPSQWVTYYSMYPMQDENKEHDTPGGSLISFFLILIIFILYRMKKMDR